MAPSVDFNAYQYTDLVHREADVYANAKYQIILGYLAGRRQLRVLNAGCGSGELSFLLAVAGHAVVGIDPAQEYIDLAKRRTPAELSGRCFFQVSSIEGFVSAEQFDCVIATDVLEHIKDDTVAWGKLVQLVKPEGDIVITVPALPSLFGYHDELLGHFRRYTKTSFRNLIAGSGIESKQLRYFGFTLIPICLLYSRIWRKPYPVASARPGSGAILRQGLLKLLLTADRFCPLPLGISLIFWGVKAE